MNILQPVGLMEADIDCNLPSEIIEMIICYFDGRTLLQFKLLSKRYYTITNNACHHKRLWKKICDKEIPYQYFFDLIKKHLNKFTSMDSITESQYEGLYKHWLQWQNNVFNKMLIGEQHFLGLDDINIIICNRLEVNVIFRKYTCTLSLIKHDSKVSMDNYLLESYKPTGLQSIMPSSQQHIINKYDQRLHKRMTYYRNGLIVYTESPNGNYKEYYSVQLTYGNTNTFAIKSWHSCHLYLKPQLLNRSVCLKFRNIMCTSVVHGLFLGRTNCNDIIIHDARSNNYTVANSWIDQKYSRVTAMYIYLNILFIGTQNGYLLAYRFQCRDDLLNLKKRNMLLEDHLNIGPIIKIDIMDNMDIKAIIVASMSKIVWIKIY